MSIVEFRKYGNQIFSAKILMLLLGCFLIYLFASSGPRSYNVFWFFIFPPAAFYLMSRPAALLFSGLFIAVGSMVLLLQEQLFLVDRYDARFIITFLSSFLIVSWISFALEAKKTRYRKVAVAVNKQRSVVQAPTRVVEVKHENNLTNNAKSEFLANMSHELRTPLNHMIGFTELVVDQKFGKLNQTQREYLNDALQSSKYLFALINDILDLKKIETGDLELVISDIDVKTLLENSLTMIRERALNHGIQISIDMNGAPMILRADQDKLTQILYNLLSNAAKFTPDGGVVTVSAKTAEVNCRRSDHKEGVKSLWTVQTSGDSETSSDIEPIKCVEFVVADSGVGINPADLERIFEHFEQADGSSRKRFQGTGLGLSLSKKYVELHGGRIWADSEGEGKGSTFSFVLPSQAGKENA